jgi:predicted deacylase
MNHVAEPVVVGGVVTEPGSRRFWSLPAGETVTGPIGVPITVVAGAAEGPTLAVTAACHPGEYNGVMASIELARRVDPTRLRGNVLIVHVQNVPGVQAKVGHLSPIDGVNMGRAFPVPGRVVETVGNVSHQTTSPTHQIAELIFEEVVLRADAYVDLHGGEVFESLPPNIEYLVTEDDDVDEKIRALARAFGFPLLWEVPQGSIPEMPGYPGRGSAVMEAALQGIPAVICEVGGEGKLEERFVELTVDGLLRALGHLGMLDVRPAGGDPPVTLVGGHVLFATRAGLFLSAVGPGDEVREGQVLGRITSLAGDVVEQFKAPEDAVLTNVVTRGVANPGDMLFVMGNLRRATA